MSNRVYIDAPAGIIDIQGEKDFIDLWLAKLFPLIEDAGFGSHLQSSGAEQADERHEPVLNEENAPEQVTKIKSKKKRAYIPPKGQSCADRIMTLREGGFLKAHRSTTEIVEGLKSKGWTHSASQVGAALTNMFGRGDIQRTKEGNGSWKYFWDRDIT